MLADGLRPLHDSNSALRGPSPRRCRLRRCADRFVTLETAFHQLTAADVTDTVLIPPTDRSRPFPNGATYAHPLRTPPKIL